MKRYLIWLWFLLKRLLKRPAFICLLIAMPAFAVVFGFLERKTEDKMIIGIAWEKSVNEKLETSLTDLVSVFDFRFYDDPDALIWAVKGKEAVCGFLIPEDIDAHLTAQTWQGKIIVYVGEDESIAQIAKEKLAAALFMIYAENSYVNLMQDSAEKAVKETDIPAQEIVDFAVAAYETHLVDGSTFAFRYGESGQGAELTAELQSTLASLSTLRGILAVCVFLCGICGLLTDSKDRQNRRFVRLTSDWMTTVVNIWIPMIPASLMMVISLYIGAYVLNISETSAGISGLRIGTEIVRLLIYQFLIILYCSIIRMVLRKRERIAVIIPILTLGSLICSPVIMRLSLYLPIFSILEKLFPVTWYLLL